MTRASRTRWMRPSRFARHWALGAGLCALQAATALTLAQGVPPSGVQPPRPTPALVRGNRLVAPMDDFAGLNLTSAQQAKVDEIVSKTKTSIDTVIKSKLDPDQKGAMIQGLEHMERNQVYLVLDPKQQEAVRKRVIARREAARLEQQKIKASAPQ